MKKAFAVMVKDNTSYRAYQWSSKETLEQAIKCAEEVKNYNGVDVVYVRDKVAKKEVYRANQ